MAPELVHQNEAGPRIKATKFGDAESMSPKISLGTNRSAPGKSQENTRKGKQALRAA